jgi:hypothetical protein
MKVCSNFLLSYFEYCKILLNILMDDHHLSNITKLNKKLLFPSHLGYKQNLLRTNTERDCYLVGGERFQGLVTFMDSSTHDKWVLSRQCLSIVEWPPLHKETVHLIIMCDVRQFHRHFMGKCALHMKACITL